MEVLISPRPTVKLEKPFCDDLIKRHEHHSVNGLKLNFKESFFIENPVKIYLKKCEPYAATFSGHQKMNL
tara:strand:+ start:247 stop:456 length:210 start_codon:yes stop_codon:yes gene_type:complete